MRALRKGDYRSAVLNFLSRWALRAQLEALPLLPLPTLDWSTSPIVSSFNRVLALGAGASWVANGFPGLALPAFITALTWAIVVLTAAGMLGLRTLEEGAVSPFWIKVRVPGACSAAHCWRMGSKKGGSFL